MEKILIILKRLNNEYVKQRLLLIFLTIQNVILSLIVLIYANVIISNGKILGEVDYGQIRLFYNITIAALFLIIVIYTPILFSRVLKNLYEENVIDHLQTVKIGIDDIIYAVFLRGISTLLILLVSAFPIISVSFYFGGFGIFKIIRLLLFVICFAVFASSISIYISTIIFDANASMIISYVIIGILALIHLFYINLFIKNNLSIFLYILFCLIMSLILLSISRRTKLFNA